MNVNVQAGSLTLGVVATMSNAKVSTVVSFATFHIGNVETTCLSFAPLTVNGHSISAINPESTFTGGMATLAMA
jgi:hypothetical protein